MTGIPFSWRTCFAAALVAVGGLFCAVQGSSQTTVDWIGGTGASALDNGSNWQGGVVPDSTKVARFASASYASGGLSPQSGNPSFGGIEIASSSGAISFTGPGSGGAKTISIGQYGITNNSANALTVDISSKVNLSLTANSTFTANGQIAITDSPTAAIRFNLNSYTLTLAGTNTASSIAQEFGGTGGLVKTGTGTWTLTGANVYTGTTAISQGTLSVSNVVVSGSTPNSHLGNATSAVVLGGATTNGALAYTGTTATFTRGFTVNAGGGTLDVTTAGQVLTVGTGNVTTSGVFTSTGSGSTTISSIISGTGSIAKSGTGTLTLDGANTFTGGVTLSAGTLTVNAGGTLGSNTTPGPLVVNGGTLNLNNSAQTVSSFSGSGGTLQLSGSHVLTANQSGNTTFSGGITGTGALTKSGNGSLTLSGVNSYSGVTTVAAGALQFANTNAFGSSNWTTAKLVVESGATAAFNVGGSGEYTSANVATLVGLGTSTGGFKSGSFIGLDTTNASGGVFTYSGNIANPGGNTLGLVKLGPGTLLLSGTNTYSGDTFVKQGTLKLGSSNALSPNTKLNVSSGANFDPNGYNLPTLTELSGAGSLAVPSTGLTVQPTGTASVFSGQLSGSGGLTLNGTGTLTLTNSGNSFTGATTISSGTLKLGANNALPSSTAVSLASSATLDLGTYSATVAKLEGSGSVSLGTGAKLTISQASGTATFDGVISGSGGLDKTGSGVLILTGTQTFTGTTTITGGELKVNGSASSSPFSLSGGTLSGSGSIGALTLTGSGVLSPGNSPGLLTVGTDGTSVSNLSGTLSFEIGGTGRGTTYDAINFNGTVNFGGTLTVTLVNGFNPVSGDSFDLFNWTVGSSGTFATLNLPTLTSGLSWNTSALTTGAGVLTVTGTAVPEPATYGAMAGAAILGFAAWRRRHRKASVTK